MHGNLASNPSPPQSSLGDECRALACALSGVPADHFLIEMLGHGLGGARSTWNATEIVERLDDPALCLRTIYSRYAFARRGKDRKVLAEIAGAALDSALEHGSLADISIEEVWQHYCSTCDAEGRKSRSERGRGGKRGR